MKSIEVIVYTDKEGNNKPAKIRLEENNQKIVIVIKRLMYVNNEKDRINYRCEIEQYGIKKLVNLIYIKNETKWYID